MKTGLVIKESMETFKVFGRKLFTPFLTLPASFSSSAVHEFGSYQSLRWLKAVASSCLLQVAAAVWKQAERKLSP